MRYKVNIGDVISGTYDGYDFTRGAKVLEVRPDGTVMRIEHPSLGYWYVSDLDDYEVLASGPGDVGHTGTYVKDGTVDGVYRWVTPRAGRIFGDWQYAHTAAMNGLNPHALVIDEVSDESGIKEKVSEAMDKFKLFLTKEPFKTYRKAGITNGDNILTDDGVKIFLTYLLEKNPEFLEVAKELVGEAK